MQYEPSFVGLRPILSDDNKHWLLKQSLRYSLDRFKSDQRNYEEVMVDFVYTYDLKGKPPPIGEDSASRVCSVLGCSD